MLIATKLARALGALSPFAAEASWSISTSWTRALQADTRSSWVPPGSQPPGSQASAAPEGSSVATNAERTSAETPAGSATESANSSSSSPMLDDIARVIEAQLGLRAGRSCVVGEGLATVDLGLFLDGRQVAIQLEQPAQPQSVTGGSDAAVNPAAAARLFAERRTQQRVLQSFGWAVATVPEQEWAKAGDNDHAKMHVIVEAVNKALGGGGDGKGEHQHSSGCGCH